MLFVRLKFIDLCDNRLTGFPNPASWKSTLLKEVMVSRNSIPKVSTPLNWWLLVTQVKLSGGKFRWNSFCMNFTDSEYFSCYFHISSILTCVDSCWKQHWVFEIQWHAIFNWKFSNELLLFISQKKFACEFHMRGMYQ